MAAPNQSTYFHQSTATMLHLCLLHLSHHYEQCMLPVQQRGHMPSAKWGVCLLVQLPFALPRMHLRQCPPVSCC